MTTFTVRNSKPLRPLQQITEYSRKSLFLVISQLLTEWLDSVQLPTVMQ